MILSFFILRKRNWCWKLVHCTINVATLWIRQPNVHFRLSMDKYYLLRECVQHLYFVIARNLKKCYLLISPICYDGTRSVEILNAYVMVTYFFSLLFTAALSI